LYSGLFDSENDREQFIVNLAESDVLLASECKNSSTVEENSISNSIEEKSQSILLKPNEPENFSNALKALANLNKNNLIKDFIQSVKPDKIEFLRNVMTILPYDKSSLEILILILNSNPQSYIKSFLNILTNLERESIYLERESIEVIFKLILTDNKIKAKYALQFYRQNLNFINALSYKEYAEAKLIYFDELQDLIDWKNIFELKIKFKDVILHLIEQNDSVKGYYTALSLMESLTDKEKLFILNKLIESKNIKNQILLFIYINVNYNYKLHFRNYRDFKTKINPNVLKVYDEFRRAFSKVYQNSKANEFIKSLKLGQEIKLRYISERKHNHILCSSNSPVSFILPFEETDTLSKFHKNQLYKAKIIFIYYDKYKVYVSINQLSVKTISFNQNYLRDINTEDIVKCRIMQRFENKTTVFMYGYSKNQKAVIYRNKEYFEGVTQLEARVINIKNNLIILEPLKLITSASDATNLIPLSFIKEKTVSDWDKIIEYLKRYSVNNQIDLQIINAQIAYILDKKIKQFFTSNKWLVSALCNLGYLFFEKGKYTVIKNFETELKDTLKNQLFEDKLSNNNAAKDLTQVNEYK
jgi:hypothetical protein